jgi:hypothetical protein
LWVMDKLGHLAFNLGVGSPHFKSERPDQWFQ